MYYPDPLTAQDEDFKAVHECAARCEGNQYPSWSVVESSMASEGSMTVTALTTGSGSGSATATTTSGSATSATSGSGPTKTPNAGVKREVGGSILVGAGALGWVAALAL